MSQTITQSMYYSTSTVKEYLFVFGHTDGFWGTRVKGFTHLMLVQLSPDNTEFGIFFEPLFAGGELDVIRLEELRKPEFLSEHTILKITVKSKTKNRLIRPIVQTCTTLIQYMASISLGALTPQGLYECLTKSNKSWLDGKGIKDVQKWLEL